MKKKLGEKRVGSRESGIRSKDSRYRIQDNPISKFKVQSSKFKVQNSLRELRAQVRALEAKSKLIEREKDAFISIVSHELRTPLSVIKGYLDLAADGIFGELPPALKEPILESRVNAERLSRLIENLLEVSRLEAGQLPFKWKSLSIHAIVSSALAEMEGGLRGKRLKVELKLEDNLPLILGDEEKVKKVLRNILQNAIKHSPNGGVIRVDSGIWVSRGKKPGKPEYIYISVLDSGGGIPRAMQKKIFNRFLQMEAPLTRRRNGTGLGLYYCKHVVEHHGGKIWVESREGKGSRFVFTLAVDPLLAKEKGRK